jgi:hypothetical protein
MIKEDPQKDIMTERRCFLPYVNTQIGSGKTVVKLKAPSRRKSIVQRRLRGGAFSTPRQLPPTIPPVVEMAWFGAWTKLSKQFFKPFSKLFPSLSLARIVRLGLNENTRITTTACIV